jgi:glycyl-tRNA synthetase
MKKDKLPTIANEISLKLSQSGIRSFYDESGSIGRRYRRQDEIGTPWCTTVDFDSLKDEKVTLRDRDTLKQERVDISRITETIASKLKK